MLDRLKEGDRINFAAEKVEGAYTVTRFETAKQAVDRNRIRIAGCPSKFSSR